MPLYEDSVKPICEKVQSLIEAKGFTVVFGRLERLSNEFPYAVIIPTEYGLQNAVLGGRRMHLVVRLEIMVLLKLLNPKIWFDDMSEPVLDVADAILANRTLSGLCYHCIPDAVVPERITTGQKTYYGGIIRVRIEADYTVA